MFGGFLFLESWVRRGPLSVSYKGGEPARVWLYAELREANPARVL